MRIAKWCRSLPPMSCRSGSRTGARRASEWGTCKLSSSTRRSPSFALSAHSFNIRQEGENKVPIQRGLHKGEGWPPGNRIAGEDAIGPRANRRGHRAGGGPRCPGVSCQSPWDGSGDSPPPGNEALERRCPEREHPLGATRASTSHLRIGKRHNLPRGAAARSATRAPSGVAGSDPEALGGEGRSTPPLSGCLRAGDTFFVVAVTRGRRRGRTPNSKLR
jgi:hypothetical protein